MKMLIMKAASVVMQHIPGLGGGTGAATPNPMNGLAEAIQQHTNTMLMHTAALGLSTASTGLNTAALALQTAAASLQASGASSGASAAAMAEYGGAVGMTSYAGGGTHWASASDLRSGGVKQPGQTTMAMFGEGHMPEAFIPMMDRRTVQMETLPNGDLHIPLPSGGSIPVSMRNNGYQAARKYADGGTSIGEAHVTAAGNEAMNNGGSRATTNQQHVNVRMGDQTTHISIDHKGDAKEDDVRAMTQKLTEHVNNIMDSRENAMMLKMIKQGGALSPTSTVGGFGGLGR